MNPFISVLIFILGGIPTFMVVWFFSFVTFDQTVWQSNLYALGGSLFVFMLVKGYLKREFLKKHHLKGKEYRYIKKNLDEAKLKINRLRKAFFQVRDVSSFKQTLDILRVTKKIYQITKKEPRRFYQAEQFYYYHLDSIVELAEKYAFLSSQPKKNSDIEWALSDTRHAMKGLGHSIEKDLNQMLSNDLEHLNFELDVVKNTIKTKNDRPIQ